MMPPARVWHGVGRLWRLWSRRYHGAPTLLVALLFGCLALAYDVGRDVENAGQHLRDRLHPRAATNTVAVIEIDAHSIAQINHWPWPRSIHAQLVDRLRAARARSIAFDVDFSAPSTATEDQRLSAALARADGAVILPTFRQLTKSGAADVFENLPIAAFRNHAFLASVNIEPDEDGLVRHYDVGVVTRGSMHPSIPALLAESSQVGAHNFPIDLSIDPATIPHYSYVDVLRGHVPTAAFKDKRVLIGATAIEMGDRYAVPRYGVLPGVIIQALATETLLQGTMNTDYGPLPLMLLALAAIYYAQRVTWNLARGLRLMGGTVIIALVPLGLEVAKLGTLDIVPALIMMIASGVMMLEMAIRDAFLHSRSTDSETGLPNLIALRRDANAGGALPVAVARIHHYGEFSMLLGAEGTAQALQRIAARLQMSSTETSVYRVEDNALAWRFDDADSEELAARFAALASLFRTPLVIGTRKLDVSLSFGVARDAATDARTLTAQALLAADRAAEQGIAWDMHSDAHGAEVDWKLSLLSGVDQALYNGEMWVAYQPKADIASGAIIGAEALVRWRHPERGPVAPDHFIPTIEKEGRMADLTLFVVRRALADLRRLREAGHHLTIAVNLSVSLLHNRTFQTDVAALIKGADVAPEYLVFEITESATFDNPERAVEAMNALRAMGVSLSIDDYGTGQSTLTYLKRLPASEIKIDKSFILDLPKSRNDQILVRSTIALAHGLGFKVVAEGIEDAECLALLASFGCDTAQGWHIGRPVAIDAFSALMTTPLALAA